MMEFVSWEGWHPIYEMAKNTCSKPPTRLSIYPHYPAFSHQSHLCSKFPIRHRQNRDMKLSASHIGCAIRDPPNNVKHLFPEISQRIKHSNMGNPLEMSQKRWMNPISSGFPVDFQWISAKRSSNRGRDTERAKAVLLVIHVLATIPERQNLYLQAPSKKTWLQEHQALSRSRHRI